ncbi:MAG: Hint domain-containing protein, partial [Pseudomonadota bacterium]
DVFVEQGNLLQNGSFEESLSGAPGGWSVGGTSAGGRAEIEARASHGDSFMALGGWSGQVGMTLSQDVTTEAGEDYTISFDLGATSGSVEQVVQIEIFDGTGTALNQTVTVPQGATDSFTFTFTATSSAATVRFTHVDGEEGDADLDNVMLVAGTTPSGDDTFDGGDDADTFVVQDGFGNDTIIGGEGGTDSDLIDLTALTVPVTVTYTGDETGTITDGTDTITFSEIEAINLGGRSDLFDGRADSSGFTLESGDGADTIFGSTGADSIVSGEGDDSIVLEDGFGDDTIRLQGGDDTVDLSALSTGVDLDYTGSGAFTLTDGTDTASIFDANGQPIGSYVLTDHDDNYDGGGGGEIFFGGGDDTLQGNQFHALDAHGEEGNDSLAGNANADTLDGGSGDDTIGGGGGADILLGGDGADTFLLQDAFGNDTIAGGEGGSDDDLLDLSALTAPVTVTYTGDEAGTITDGTDTITFSEIERIVLGDAADVFSSNAVATSVDVSGGAGNDTIDTGSSPSTISGGAGDDSLIGGIAEDSISGGADNDFLEAHDGADTLDGGSGSDTLLAGDGDDAIAGGLGDDSLTGGLGDDTFTFAVGDGSDTITDFNTGNGGTLSDGDGTNNDFIDLSAYYDDIWELHADQADDGILNQSNDGAGGTDYSDNTQFAPGDGLTFSGASADGSFFTSENTGVVCFAAGTAIRTPRGDVLIDDLRVGDLVSTLDNGPQRIRWIGRRRVSRAELAANPKLLPVRVRRGLLGAERDLLVSRQHCLLMRQDTLVRAIHLARMPDSGIRVVRDCREIEYIHLMFDAHEIIRAEGVPAESFYPGPCALNALSIEQFRTFGAACPTLLPGQACRYAAQTLYGATARPVATWQRASAFHPCPN